MCVACNNVLTFTSKIHLILRKPQSRDVTFLAQFPHIQKMKYTKHNLHANKDELPKDAVLSQTAHPRAKNLILTISHATTKTRFPFSLTQPISIRSQTSPKRKEIRRSFFYTIPQLSNSFTKQIKTNKHKEIKKHLRNLLRKTIELLQNTDCIHIKSN